MRLTFVALAIFSSSMKAFIRAAVAIALFGAIIIAGSGVARAAGLPDPCPTGNLDTGTGQDLVINKECHAGSGKYLYGKVNIIKNGKLIFDEKIADVKIDFWASSILVEDEGSLIAGTPGACDTTTPSKAQPFGCNRGMLAIHLYGKDQGNSGVGITCKSSSSADVPPCGISGTAWNSNGKKKVPLPGTVPYEDYFYQYQALPFDDGQDTNNKNNPVGYFGYKVLAVSFGGTLQLFGNKGADYTIPDTGAGPKNSGRSWGRLDGTIFAADAEKSLTVATASPVNWQVGDHIIVTTTDYLPNHSEELVICSIAGNKIGYTSDITATPVAGMPATCPVKGVQWTHNGDQFQFGTLPSRLNISKTAAETRAAVGLLTRSIRIVSEGNTSSDPFPAALPPPSPPCPADPAVNPCTDRYFGGHTIARQGFKLFQIQGVEFRQMGQGGRLGHYPIHFHMARQTPAGTFVKDSSINESMTRWITVHATQGVTLDRNVGYLSIGHGFYLEDAVETDNKFYSNLGIFARAAVENDQNPRRVPGILASPDVIVGRPPPNPLERVRYESDRETPAVFWITNGWNDFQGNMAAGAGMCGVCFWQLPASISGPSRSEKWESYAAEQRCPLTPVQPKDPPFFTPPFAQVCDRTGTSPIMNFDGNFCTSAMTSFSDVGFLQACPGVVQPPSADPNSVPWVNNPKAPRSLALKPECGPGTKWPICSDDYYPNIDDGQVKQATQCPTGQCDDPKPTVILCQESDETNCLPTVINDYTSSFHWAQYNFSAIWLRTRWHLVSNSFISDVQNAGLSFISGGDYTHSSAIKGLWELALKTVFVGSTQAGVNGLTDPAHAFASVLTPFSPASAGLTCDNNNIGLYCLSKNNSVTIGGFSGFSVSQHMFNIYDGPAHEDSNAYLNIKRIPLNPVSNSVYKAVLGIPKAVRADPPGHPEVPTGQCYMQNAAIAWKQSNGFYYPPTFHSANLFFNNVDIRHYVIVPQFISNTYTTNAPEAADRYCTQNNGLFTGFSAIDRQTELTDDDGSLTGYKKTISVNEDPFFKAPVTGIECDSDGAVKEGGTATTSPYDYVTTVVYPDCNKQGGGGGPECTNFYPKNPPPTPGEWDADCANQTCFGVPLYREYQTGSEVTGNKISEFIRMAGSAIYQRETMTVDHGRYYVDVTASDTTQTGTPVISPPCPTCQPSLPWQHKNVFVKNETYDFFLVYATLKTEQTYQMYVGTGRTMADVVNSVKPIRVNTANAPFVIHEGTSATDKSAIQVKDYDSTKGVVTVNINLQGYTNEFTNAAAKLCVPQTFCKLSGTTCVAKDAGIIHGTTQAERDITCGYANKDIDCPTDLTDPTGKTIGCVGFSVTLPGNFVANNQTGDPGSPTFLPKLLEQCFPKDAIWNPPIIPANPDRVGTCTTAHAPLTPDFCAAAASSRLLGR